MHRPCTWVLSPAILFLTLFVWFQRAEAAGNQGWVVVDGIVATIKDVPVLRSDVSMEADLGLLNTADTGEEFDSLLESYLNRLLILQELEDIGGFRLAEGQAEDAFREYLVNYGDISVFDEKLKNWGITEAEVFRRMERALLASMYTESRIKFFVKVLPSDIEKAYEENPDRWGNAGVIEAWEDIRSELMQKSFKRERDRWLASLRERYDLILLVDEGRSP